MNAPPICIHRLLFPLLPSPPLPAAIGFRAVRAQAPLGEFAHQRAAVISLVGNHFARSVLADVLHNFIAIGIRHHTRNALACFGYCFGNRCSVSNVRTVQRDGDNRSSLHIHRMLGLVSQMRAPAHLSSW